MDFKIGQLVESNVAGEGRIVNILENGSVTVKFNILSQTRIYTKISSERYLRIKKDPNFCEWKRDVIEVWDSIIFTTERSSLVKNYNSVSKDLRDLVVLNTQALTGMQHDIRENQFCPQMRIDKQRVQISGKG